MAGFDAMVMNSQVQHLATQSQLSKLVGNAAMQRMFKVN
jgi:hypothetical protein